MSAIKNSAAKAKWTPVGVAAEGQPIAVDGLNPWQWEWKRTNESEVELPHPSYPGQKHVMGIYKITDGSRTVRFAAGELSANVYGFYVARPQSISAQETQVLLDSLCQAYGFCLSPLWRARLENDPPYSPAKFTDTVFRAEGLDPTTADTGQYKLIYNQVKEVFVRSGCTEDQ